MLNRFRSLSSRNPAHVSLLLFVALGVFCSGCGSSESTTDAKPDHQADAGATLDQKCRSKLAAAIRRHAPLDFALQANPERSINSLNAWLASCAADDVKALSLDEAALALVGKNVRATASRFTVSDAAYIRDCLLLRDLSNSVCARALESVGDPTQQDVTRVKALFEWVVRNISLISATESRPPVGLFDVLMTGYGTAEDRAWIFAEALRQHQFDGFIVRPSDSGTQEGTLLETAPWLFAVTVNESSMLFDLTTGLAIEDGESTDVLNPQPAGLSILEGVERWKDSTAEIVAQLSTFAPRMFVLQQELVGDDSAIMFEELTGGVSEIRPMTERIEEIGGGLWTTAQITLWSWPEQRTVAAQSRSEDEEAEYDSVMRLFEGPFEREPFVVESTEEMTVVPEELSQEQRRALLEKRLLENFAAKMESSEAKFGTPSRRMLKTRLAQILGGDVSAVIQQFQQVRITGMEPYIEIRVPQVVQQDSKLPPVIRFPLPVAIKEMNFSTTGASLYWTAMQQMEVGDYGAAISTLVNYRRQYESGRWKYASMINQAISLLHQKRVDDAVEILKEADTGSNPEQARVKSLLQRLAE